MVDWAHAGSSVGAAFLASLVDFVEALIIVLAWCAVAASTLPRLPLNGGWRAVLLFAGCAAILVVSVARAAHRVRADAVAPGRPTS